MATGTGSKGNPAAQFPNDERTRGRDRKGRRTLPPSDGNPRQVSSTFSQQGGSISPETFGPTETKDQARGKFGLDFGDTYGP